MRSFLLIPVVLLVVACGPGGGGTPDAGDDGDGKELLRYALEAVEAPASALVASDVNVVATVTATPAGLKVLPGAQAVAEPAAGVLVNFRVVSGGGHVYAGAALTNASGQAREIWTLGTAAGEQVIEARAVDPDTGAPVVYGTTKTLSLPGDPVTYGWAPSHVYLPEADSAWDYSAIHREAWDRHGNYIAAVPQGSITFTRTYWTGRTWGSATAPGACTVTGTLITCPREFTCFVGSEGNCYSGQYFAEFSTDWPEQPTLTVRLDQPG